MKLRFAELGLTTRSAQRRYRDMLEAVDRLARELDALPGAIANADALVALQRTALSRAEHELAKSTTKAESLRETLKQRGAEFAVASFELADFESAAARAISPL